MGRAVSTSWHAPPALCRRGVQRRHLGLGVKQARVPTARQKGATAAKGARAEPNRISNAEARAEAGIVRFVSSHPRGRTQGADSSR